MPSCHGDMGYRASKGGIACFCMYLSVAPSLSCLSCVLSGWSGMNVEAYMHICMYVGMGHGQCWFWPVCEQVYRPFFLPLCVFLFLGMSEGMFVCMCHGPFVFLSL